MSDSAVPTGDRGQLKDRGPRVMSVVVHEEESATTTNFPIPPDASIADPYFPLPRRQEVLGEFPIALAVSRMVPQICRGQLQ